MTRAAPLLLAVVLAGCTAAEIGSPDTSVAPATDVAPDVAAGATSIDLPVPADAWRATVDHVVDGDTVWVVSLGGPGAPEVGTEVKLRLLRIDTPELSRDGRPAECLAEAARDHLGGLLSIGEPVHLAWDVERQDRFGRDLVHLWDEEGRWINGTMLAEGYARVATFPPNVAHDERVRAAERAARESDLGLWSRC